MYEVRVSVQVTDTTFQNVFHDCTEAPLHFPGRGAWKVVDADGIAFLYSVTKLIVMEIKEMPDA